jgi:hypothetical protein
MPKYYPLRIDHQFHSPAALAKEVEEFVQRRHDEILDNLLPRDNPVRTDALMDAGGPEAILDELSSILLEGIAQVRATPNRPLKALIDAMKVIGRKPKLVIEQHDQLEPEATVQLAREYIALSRGHRMQWLEFERKPGAPLDEKSLKIAAQTVRQRLESQQRPGRVIDSAQRELTMSLGGFFLKFNPSVGRVVTGTGEKGRLKQFMRTVLPIYLKHARPFGRAANLDTMVRIAADASSSGRRGRRAKHT